MFFFADLSGPIAERLSHGDVTHSRRTGGLTIIQCLSSLGCPGNRKKRHKKEKKKSISCGQHISDVKQLQYKVQDKAFETNNAPQNIWSLSTGIPESIPHILYMRKILLTVVCCADSEKLVKAQRLVLFCSEEQEGLAANSRVSFCVSTSFVGSFGLKYHVKNRTD